MKDYEIEIEEQDATFETWWENTTYDHFDGDLKHNFWKCWVTAWKEGSSFTVGSKEYRELETGEIVKEGDECYDDEVEEWREATLVGWPVLDPDYTPHLKYRRKVFI